MVTLAQVRAEVEAVYRRDSRRILATLIRLLGDFDLAEEALHEAFAAADRAFGKWTRRDVPTIKVDDPPPAMPRVVVVDRRRTLDPARDAMEGPVIGIGIAPGVGRSHDEL